MFYTESETSFWKYHSMGCGYSGKFRKVHKMFEEPDSYECPVCGSEYRPEQEYKDELIGFAGDSIDMFTRATDQELIEELENRGYKVEKLARTRPPA